VVAVMAAVMVAVVVAVSGGGEGGTWTLPWLTTRAPVVPVSL
jgi:hypothetical protein